MISFVPRQLKEKGYKRVLIASWKENKFVFDNNPYVDEVIPLEPLSDTEFFRQVKEWSFDHDVFDFRFVIEKKFLQESISNRKSIDELISENYNKNYYRDSLKAYDLIGEKGDLYLSQDEKNRLNKYKDGKKRIAWQFTGSSRNKRLLYAFYYIKKIIEKLSNVEHWLFDDITIPNIFEHKNIIDKRGELSPRKVLSLIPMFDLVVSPETFLVHVAGAFDIPTLTFYSHSSYENLGKYFKNHYPVIPECDCYPCYTIIKDWKQIYQLDNRENARNKMISCLYASEDMYRSIGFKCCTQINHENVIKKIIEILE